MKKIAALFCAMIACIMLFSSCSSVTSDPLDLAKFFVEEDYYASLNFDSDDIEYYADAFDVSPRGIDYVVYASDWDDNYKSGCFMYCESNKKAKKLVEDLEDNFEDFEDDFNSVKNYLAEKYHKDYNN